MLLNIILGSIFFGIIYLFYSIIFPKSTTNVTTTTLIPITTQVPNTTTQIPNTTTQVPNITTQIPNITTQTPTTTQLKVRKTFFQAGQGGTPKTITDAYDNTYSQAPGGAGGILINNQGPKSQDGYGVNGNNGPGGIGYGSGGGASAFCQDYYGLCQGSGNGSPGFVYLVQDDILFTSDTIYTIQSNFLIYTFIIMGGGACGTYNGSTSRDYFIGGSCGQIVIKQIKGNIKGTQINIKVGQGGNMQNVPTSEGFERWFSFSAGNSSVSFIFNGNKTEYIAYGALPPNNNYIVETSKYTSLAKGGNYDYSQDIGLPGGTIPQSFIDNMNSTNPNPTI